MVSQELEDLKVAESLARRTQSCWELAVFALRSLRKTLVLQGHLHAMSCTSGRLWFVMIRFFWLWCDLSFQNCQLDHSVCGNLSVIGRHERLATSSKTATLMHTFSTGAQQLRSGDWQRRRRKSQTWKRNWQRKAKKSRCKSCCEKCVSFIGLEPKRYTFSQNWLSLYLRIGLGIAFGYCYY